MARARIPDLAPPRTQSRPLRVTLRGELPSTVGAKCICHFGDAVHRDGCPFARGSTTSGGRNRFEALRLYQREQLDAADRERRIAWGLEKRVRVKVVDELPRRARDLLTMREKAQVRQKRQLALERPSALTRVERKAVESRLKQEAKRRRR